MNQRLMRTNPFTQVGLITIVLSFTSVACVAQRAAVSGARVLSAAQPAEAEVLLYTDNSPGSVFWAKTEQEVSRRMGMAVEVVTDEEAFIEALPERTWKQVIVVARYERGEPSYAAALREYMRTDEGEGKLSDQELFDQYARDIRVRFSYWYDNPASRAADVPGTFVVASTLTLDWRPTGRTVISYSGGGPDASETSIVPGYVFATFDSVSPDSVKRFKNSVMKVLEPGVYAAKVAPESGLSSANDGDDGPVVVAGNGDLTCSQLFFPELDKCEKTFDTLRVDCGTAFGPNGGNDPTGYNECLDAASDGNTGCRKGVFKVYVICELVKAAVSLGGD